MECAGRAKRRRRFGFSTREAVTTSQLKDHTHHTLATGPPENRRSSELAPAALIAQTRKLNTMGIDSLRALVHASLDSDAHSSNEQGRTSHMSISFPKSCATPVFRQHGRAH